MNRNVILSAAACLLFVLVPIAKGDFVLSFDAAGNRNFDTGAAGAGKVLSVFISQEVGESDTVAGVVADFDLEVGVLTGSTISDTGATGTPGFWGAGDLNASSITPLDGGTAFEVNQEFNSTSHGVMNEPNRELWFEIVIDTTGFAPGTYSLGLRDPAGSFIDNGFNFIGVNNDLQFMITAIPEPGGFSLMATIAGIAIARRRRNASA